MKLLAIYLAKGSQLMASLWISAKILYSFSLSLTRSHCCVSQALPLSGSQGPVRRACSSAAELCPEVARGGHGTAQLWGWGWG